MGTFRSSRFTYIFTIIVWIVLLSSTVILYNHIISLNMWTPSVNTWIDRAYLILHYILTVSLIVSILNLVFREIRHSGVMGNILVRRFLPIVRFIITAAIWIIGLFSLLDTLHINTYNIIAGA